MLISAYFEFDNTRGGRSIMRQLLNRYSAQFLIFLLLAVSLLVTLFSIDSYKRFTLHQEKLAAQAVRATAGEISHMIAIARRSVKLFAEQEAVLIARLSSTPDDSAAYGLMDEKILRYFPGRFAFTIADPAGRPLLKQSDTLLSVRCRHDLKQFASQTIAPEIYIHRFSNHDSYHFDVMTHLANKTSKPSLFFISFQLNELARLLSSGSVAGHELLMAEVLHRGAAQTTQSSLGGAVKRRLFGSEQASLRRVVDDISREDELARAEIEGASWVLLDRVRPGLYREELTSQVLKAITIMALFLGFGIVLMSLFRREENTTGRTRKTFLGIEADRRRIAMDMHDQVLSDLTHLARQCTVMRKSVGEPAVIMAHLDNSEITLEEIAQAIRAIIDDLHPATLDMLGLEESLRNYLENKLMGADHSKFELETRNFQDERLTEAQKLNLYRIILEIVHNIVRHAKAAHCRIRLTMSKAHLVLSIEDDGAGFDLHHDNRIDSRGLANVSTRSQLIGARIQWRKPERFDHGTRFELELPLASHLHDARPLPKELAPDAR